MMMLGLYDAPPSAGGDLLLDASPFTSDVTFSTNSHGFEALPATIRRRLLDTFRFYDQPGLIYIALTWNGQILWEGRLEDPAVSADDQGSGLKIQALGAWRALTDAPYTALWSVTSVAGFRPIIETEITSRTPKMYGLDAQNRVFLAPQKNAVYANNSNVGAMVYEAPDSESRSIVGVQFDFEYLIAANWIVRCIAYDSSWSGSTVWTSTSAGALLTGSINVTFTGVQRVAFEMFNSTGANYTYTGENGQRYAKFTNVRMVSATTNRINTTLTVARTNGSPVTLTVGSTTRMYVGQRLIINSAGANSESVVVISIPSSTTFTANVVNAPGGGYIIGTTVTAHVIYADEIAKDLVSVVNALNSNQLSSSTALIQSPGLDLTDEIYEDQFPADILTHLAALGDNQTTPRQWEACVWEGRVLAFRPRGDAAKVWYVDVTDLSIARTLEDLANSVYGVYQDTSNRTLRTAANTDNASVTRYGLTRRQSLSADTTSSTQVGIQRDAQLADHKDPLPRASVAFRAVYDAAGSRWPLYLVRSGDTITIRNLPPSISTSIDRVRTFRISHTRYSLSDRTLDIELEVPPPRLATMLARRAEGIR